MPRTHPTPRACAVRASAHARPGTCASVRGHEQNTQRRILLEELYGKRHVLMAAAGEEELSILAQGLARSSILLQRLRKASAGEKRQRNEVFSSVRVDLHLQRAFRRGWRVVRT